MRGKDVCNTSVSCVRSLEGPLLLCASAWIWDSHPRKHLYLFDRAKSHPFCHKIIGSEGLLSQFCGHVIVLTLCNLLNGFLALRFESGGNAHLLCMTLPGMVATPRVEMRLWGKIHKPEIHTTLQGFRPQLSQLCQMRQITWVKELGVAAGAVEETVNLLVPASRSIPPSFPREGCSSQR